MQAPRLVAVDSNILLALAEEDEETLDAWDIVRNRLRPVLLFASPTVLKEVGYQAGQPGRTALKILALKALRELRSRWMVQPVFLRPEQFVLVERAASVLRHSGLLPVSERNDALIFAEASVLECMLLVSKDSHLRELDHSSSRRILAPLELVPPLVASPREIINKFDN